MSDYLMDIFGPQGLMAGAIPGYEYREGQLELARHVDLGMREERNVLAEGNTGCGKGWAYLTPAAYWAAGAKKRCVVATANIALQEQLTRKDLPTLAKVLPIKFTFALLKGIGNYACLAKPMEGVMVGAVHKFNPQQAAQWKKLQAWMSSTTTGDRSELDFEPDGDVWAWASTSSYACTGEHCSKVADCFYMHARQAAYGADILVTNFHLLLHSLLLLAKNPLANPPIPLRDHLILDEAHEVADVAREVFGFSIAPRDFGQLASHADGHKQKDLALELKNASREYFAGVRAHATSPAYDGVRLRASGHLGHAMTRKALEAYLAFSSDLGSSSSGHDARTRARATGMHTAAVELQQALQRANKMDDPNTVVWIDKGHGDYVEVRGATIDPSKQLAAYMLRQHKSVTLTSATMTAGGSFDFIAGQIGFGHLPTPPVKVVAKSPFDYQRQGLLVVPTGLPAPADPVFPAAAARALTQIVKVCKGRTLALFTSYKNMHEARDALRRARLPYKVLVQGEAPRSVLIAEFRANVGSVLLGVASLWTGVDIPGEALTCLVIDKLPFPNPKDPITNAIEAQTKNTFMQYYVPRAAITLRQGAGRLIRSRTDVGVIVVLDKRMVEARYGGILVRSLPAMMSSRSLEGIEVFLKDRGAL